MDKLFAWRMRTASKILFVIAIFVFVVGLEQAIVELRGAADDVSIDGAPVGQRSYGLLMAVVGVIRAASSAAWPLAAAAALHRWDHRAVFARPVRRVSGTGGKTPLAAPLLYLSRQPVDRLQCICSCCVDGIE